MVAACERLGVPLDRIEDIAAGCVNTAHEGMGDIARWGALAAGFPDSVPAVTVNRFCASSLTGAINIAHAIRSGELEVGTSGRRRVDVAFWLGPNERRRPVQPTRSRAPSRHHVGRCRGTAQPCAAGPERLRRDDQDGTERGGSLRIDPRGDRRFCAALAPSGGGGPRLGAAGPRDPPGRDSRDEAQPWPDVRARRGHPGRHHRRAVGRSAATAEHHPNDGGKLVGPQRRGQRRRAGQRLLRPSRWVSHHSHGWWPRPRTRSTPSTWGSLPPSPSPRPCSVPGCPPSTSMCGRSTRRSPPRHSAYYVSCLISSTASRSPTTA